MDSSTQALTDDTKSMSDLLELVEKQRIQLNEKDKELETKEQKNKELSAKLNLVMARAYEVADELKAALTTSESEKKEYRQTIQAYKIQLELKDEKDEENKESSANLDLAMSRTNKVDELKTELANAQQMNDEQLEADKIQLEEKDKELDAAKTRKTKNHLPQRLPTCTWIRHSRANQVDELKTESTSAPETDNVTVSSQTGLATLTSPMDSTSHTAADDIIGVSSGMEMANKKLMIQQLEEKKILLEDKIKEMETNEVEMQKLLTGYECEKAGANQANAEMVEIAKRLTVVVTKQKKCLEIHKEFIDKLLAQLKEKDEQLEEKKQDNEELLANLKKSRFFILADDVA